MIKGVDMLGCFSACQGILAELYQILKVLATVETTSRVFAAEESFLRRLSLLVRLFVGPRCACG